jgi:hypothetical protein
VYKKFIKSTMLAVACLVFAGHVNSASLIFSNYTNTAGTVFLGASPAVLGPHIGINGASVNWSPVLNGMQPVGLQVGSTSYTCHLNGGRLVLNSALYKGDTITISYGQLQFPSGIACGCIGSACSMA